MSFIHLLNDTGFHQAIRKEKSPSAMGAVELLRAAFWVLSYPMPAQALMLFHQALEVACKRVLQEVHVLLAADKVEYKLSKWAVRDRLAAHRLGRKINSDFDIDDYDPSRTCTFEDAWSRVREMVSLKSYKDIGLDKLTKLRNQITHRGAEEDRRFEYSQAILDIALPAIEQFYYECYERLNLSALLGEDLVQELRVAREYLAAVEQDERLPKEVLLHTFRCKYQQPMVIGVAHLLYDENGNMRDLGWDRQAVEDRIYSKLDSQLGERGSLLGKSFSLVCKICDEPGIIVGIAGNGEYELEGKRAVDPCSLFCPSCGFDLPKSCSVLAKLHFGPITDEMIGEEAWRNEVPR